MGIFYFIRLGFIVLQNYCVFYKLEICNNPFSSKSIGTIFSIAFAHFISLSQFDNSHNISCFFIIIVFIMVIFDIHIML